MSAATFKEKGNKHLQAQEFDEAIAAYTEAINLDPKDHVFFSNRSAAYLSKGDAKNALSDAERCITLNGTWPKGYSRKGLIVFIFALNYTFAIVDELIFPIYIGAALHALRKYDEAITVYESGLSIAPTDAGLKSGLAEVQKVKESSQNSSPFDDSNGLFGPQMLAKLAGHPKFGPKLGDPAFRMKLQLAQKNPQMMISDPEMMEVFQALIGSFGAGSGAGGEEDNGGIPSPNANASSSSSSSSSNKRKDAPPPPEPDLTEEEKAEKDIKVRSAAAKEKGNALYKDKKFSDALSAYDEAIAIDPSNLMIYNNKAAVYIEMGETQTAIDTCNFIFEKAKTIKFSFEDRAKVYQRIAAAHLKVNDIPEALKAYGKAQMESFDKNIERKVKNLELEKKKKDYEAYINPQVGLEAKERGNAAFRDSNFPQAIAEYEEAVKRDPTNAAYYNNLAAAYFKMVRQQQ